jgi:hypothetical protein
MPPAPRQRRPNWHNITIRPTRIITPHIRTTVITTTTIIITIITTTIITITTMVHLSGFPAWVAS